MGAGTVQLMEAQKEQIPRQDLPDGGSAVPSASTNHEGWGVAPLQKNSMPTKRRSKVAVATNHSAAITEALDAAIEVVNDESLDELDWLPILKGKLANSDTPFRESDLERYLRQAKHSRDGRKDFVGGDSPLRIRKDEWLWRGVIMREATNMIFALPKIGKTRLMLSMLSAFLKGSGEFAGLALHPGKEKLLILGPDQSESSWASYLQKAGLADEGGHLTAGVLPIATAETVFQLDSYWLSRVEEVLRAQGPLVVLLDSYSAAIRSTGLDENRSEAATPLMQLHNLISTYQSTLIVIHHANKAGGEGSAARASRGSSAITAAADNLIEMTRFKGDQEEGTKKYELRVEGRAETDGAPLIGYSKHSNEWTSFGSVSDARAEAAKDDAYNGLTTAQLQMLDVLVKATVEEKQGLTVQEISERMHEEPTKSQQVWVSKTLKRFIDLGIAYPNPGDRQGSRYKQNFYQATGWAVSKHQLVF